MFAQGPAVPEARFAVVVTEIGRPDLENRLRPELLGALHSAVDLA